MANTLYEYYTGQGKALPTVQERSAIYESSGLGAANTYTGSAQQNTQLLAALNKPQVTAVVPKTGTGVMAADALMDTQKAAELPSLPTDSTNYNGIIASGATMIPAAPTTPEDANTPPAWLQRYLDNAPKPTNPMDNYTTLVKDTGLEEKQKLFNDLTAQLKSITAETQADSLKMEGEGINLDGATARNITAERNAAIRSLPIQAQLSAARGNLALAQDKVNTLFGIQSKYETDLFNYKQNLIDKVFDYATDQEKERLQDKRDQNTRDFQTLRDQISTAKDLATKAIEAGQSALAGQIMGLDPNDPSYMVNLSSLAGEISSKLPATASIQEYEYAKKNGYVGTFEQYQNDDANRKAAIQNGSGLSGPQLTAFNSLADKQNKSPLIAAADRTIILKNAIEQVRKDPGNASQQLSLVYSYIQALDTYQSAVREGELSLVNSIDSKVGQFQSSIEKIQNGQIVRPEVILQIADSAKNIVDTIQEGADRKRQQFKSQAEVQGLGGVWNQYMTGSTNNSFEDSPAPTGDNLWSW
jgi:hypothetical protein